MEKGKRAKRVKYLGREWESDTSVIKGKIYDCHGIEDCWYRVIDEEGEDYLNPAIQFEVVEWAE